MIFWFFVVLLVKEDNCVVFVNCFLLILWIGKKLFVCWFFNVMVFVLLSKRIFMLLVVLIVWLFMVMMFFFVKWFIFVILIEEIKVLIVVGVR